MSVNRHIYILKNGHERKFNKLNKEQKNQISVLCFFVHNNFSSTRFLISCNLVSVSSIVKKRFIIICTRKRDEKTIKSLLKFYDCSN